MFQTVLSLCFGIPLLVAGRGASDDEPPSELEPPAASATGESLDDNEAAEFVEIMYKGRTIRVPIQSGQPGTVDLGDTQWKLHFTRPDAGEEAPAPGAGARERPSKQPEGVKSAAEHPARWTPETIALVGAMGVVLAIVLLYFFVIDPMRRRRPLNEALRIIRQDHRPQFPRAEELLDQSLLAGLRWRDIARARFALAYLRCLLNKYAEAATVLGDLEKSRAPIDGATAYLMLWVHARLKNHDRVERIYNEHEELLAGYHQAALIVSISYLMLARLRWARREINGAMHYFDLVRQLEVLADEIPSHIDDHEVVMGTVALFEKNRDEAVKHFQAAVNAAEQRNKSTYPGRLGLLLCDWRSETPRDIDEPLGRVLAEMHSPDEENAGSRVPVECPHCGKQYKVKPAYRGKKVQCKGCRRRFVVDLKPESATANFLESQETDSARERLLTEDELLLRNVRLWYCLTRIVSWFQRKVRSGLPDSERTTLRDRLYAVSTLDPDLGDPHLIGGLIGYYFAASEQERRDGRALIEQAVERDVHVPEVLQLLDRENKLVALSEHSLTYFHQLSRQYAENSEVDPELRQRFVRAMNGRRRFRELGAIEGTAAGQAVAPSLENLQGRGKILQTRVSNIVHYRLTEVDDSTREEIKQRLDELQERSRNLSENARAFQQSEFGLMESTGEFLFGDEKSDEQPTDSPAADPEGDDH